MRSPPPTRTRTSSRNPFRFRGYSSHLSLISYICNLEPDSSEPVSKSKTIHTMRGHFNFLQIGTKSLGIKISNHKCRQPDGSRTAATRTVRIGRR